MRSLINLTTPTAMSTPIIFYIGMLVKGTSITLALG